MLMMNCTKNDGLARNNLTLCELLQPFSKLTADVTLKDPEGANHAVAGLAVNFLDFRKDPCRMVNQKLMADLLAENCDEPMVSRYVDRQLVSSGLDRLE